MRQKTTTDCVPKDNYRQYVKQTTTDCVCDKENTDCVSKYDKKYVKGQLQIVSDKKQNKKTTDCVKSQLQTVYQKDKYRLQSRTRQPQIVCDKTTTDSV